MRDVPTPFSSDGARRRWTTADGGDVELELRWDNEAWTASVRTTREKVECVLRVSPSWSLRQLLLFRDLDQPDLWLANDGHARWGEINGAHRPELDGCTDLDVPTIPFATTLPIRRLGMQIGDAAELHVAVVDTETLGVVAERQILARVGARSWRLVADGRQLDVDFEVDEHGIPIDIGDFRRAD